MKQPSGGLDARSIRKPVGTGIWWINYFAAGKRHREKVGRKSDAIKLYQSRKSDATAGRKLPELRDSNVATSAKPRSSASRLSTGYP